MKLCNRLVLTFGLVAGLVMIVAAACQRSQATAPPDIPQASAQSCGGCQTGDDCPQPMGPCFECPDGTFACPSARCEEGRCIAEFPECREKK